MNFRSGLSKSFSDYFLSTAGSCLPNLRNHNADDVIKRDKNRQLTNDVVTRYGIVIDSVNDDSEADENSDFFPTKSKSSFHGKQKAPFYFIQVLSLMGLPVIQLLKVMPFPHTPNSNLAATVISIRSYFDLQNFQGGRDLIPKKIFRASRD